MTLGGGKPGGSAGRVGTVVPDLIYQMEQLDLQLLKLTKTVKDVTGVSELIHRTEARDFDINVNEFMTEKAHSIERQRLAAEEKARKEEMKKRRKEEREEKKREREEAGGEGGSRKKNKKSDQTEGDE